MSKPKIFIAGHKGMVGSSLVKLLKDHEGEIITKDKSELDLLNQQDVQNFFKNGNYSIKPIFNNFVFSFRNFYNLFCK